MNYGFNEPFTHVLAFAGVAKFIFPAIVLCTIAVSVPVQRCAAAS